MSDEYSSMSDEELLRAAIRFEREHHPGDAAADFFLGQLYAGSVAGHNDLELVWNEETAPLQVELDLHLHGGREDREHVTRADLLAKFVSGINDAAKAIVRANTGSRVARNLLVHGVSPGSVRVVFQADSASVDPAEPAMSSLDHFASSPDSEALRTVARLFNGASEDEPLIAADVADLPLTARRALKRSANALQSADWIIDGQIRQRGRTVDELNVTPRGAKVLLDELEAREYEREVQIVRGVIDGFRRSLGSMYLEAISGTRSVSITVADPAVLARAAQLAAVKDTPVLATIETLRTATGDGDRLEVSRRLIDIQPADQQLSMLDQKRLDGSESKMDSED